MSHHEPYEIRYGPLRQFVGDLSRVLAALLPVTRLQVRRVRQWPLAPLLVTAFVRHESNLPKADLLYSLIEALRPGAFTVGFHVSNAGARWGFPRATWVEFYIYDQPIPAGFYPKGHPKPRGRS